MQMGIRHYWLATGELRDARFEVPDGNLDVSIAKARLINVDFSGQQFKSFCGHASVFEGCDFSNTAFDQVLFGTTGYGGGQWDGRDWPETVYRNCTFTRNRRTKSSPYFGNARFEECLFDRTRLLENFSAEQAQFVDCTFRGRIRDVNFWGRPLEPKRALGREGNEFRGNDFTAAELVGVTFKHIDLRAQRFPDATDHVLLVGQSDDQQ